MKQQQTYRIIGEAPLVMHNGQLANPFNQYAKLMKKISGKRQKTDADLEELARLEWYGGLYTENGLPCIPGECLEATLLNAAKKRKLGKQASAGLIIEHNALLEYEGPKSLDALWELDEFRYFTKVRVSTSSIMRMRPIFHEWATSFVVTFNDEILNGGDITEIVRIGGEVIGILDRRPKFGRYRLG